MQIEGLIMISAWVVTPLVVWRLVPKEKWFDAHVAYLFSQMVCWFLGIVIADMRWADSPYRDFANASRLNTIFSLLLYPTLTALSVIRMPQRGTTFAKIGHYTLWSLGITLLSALIEAYTDLIEYHLHGSVFWLFFLVLIGSTHFFYQWFKKGVVPLRKRA